MGINDSGATKYSITFVCQGQQPKIITEKDIPQPKIIEKDPPQFKDKIVSFLIRNSCLFNKQVENISEQTKQDYIVFSPYPEVQYNLPLEDINSIVERDFICQSKNISYNQIIEILHTTILEQKKKLTQQEQMPNLQQLSLQSE